MKRGQLRVDAGDAVAEGGRGKRWCEAGSAGRGRRMMKSRQRRGGN